MNAIQRKDLESAVSEIESGIITLLSGESLYFECIEYHTDYQKDFSKLTDSVRGQVDVTDKIDLDDSLLIENREVPPEHWIFIPPENVYNVISVEFSGGKPPYPRQVSPIPTFRQLAYEDSMNTALSSKVCHLEPMLTTSDIDIDDQDPTPKPIDFGQNVPLYCDWDFFERNFSGITGIGAGAFGFSFSTSWDEDLKAKFAKSLDSNFCALDELESRSEATVVGQVDFFGQEPERLTEKMEGEEWIFGVISNNSIDSLEELEKMDFLAAYFKRPSFLFPDCSWEYIQNDLHVYGEILKRPMELGSVDIEWVMKVRSIAYIDKPRDGV